VEEIEPEPFQEGDEDLDGHYAASPHRFGTSRSIGWWKRRDLFASHHSHDRIIYDIYDDRITVLVVQAEEHYNDK
jgi:mRNA-degrading endonuclease RelE of RelBE toxin-antitoxin system